MTPELTANPAQARKRRREIIQTLRGVDETESADVTLSLSNPKTMVAIDATAGEDLLNVPPKKRKLPAKGETLKKTETAKKIGPTGKEAPGGSPSTVTSLAEENQSSGTESNVSTSKQKEANKRKKPPAEKTPKKGAKTQIRYDPDVPMTKEQLAAWRREARRVRNRESAAASRQRIRDRIEELEDEVSQWRTKYNEAMERLSKLQHQSGAAMVAASPKVV